MKLYKTKKNCGKLLLGILAFCTGMILLTGCGSSSEQKQNKNEETAEENKEENKVQIGLTVDSFVIERWIRDRDVFVATARELGAEVNVQDAGADVKEQISQIEYFINKQVDVIVVTAVNDAENIREVLPFGVVDYLLKPFAADRFAEALERFVQRRQVINAMSGLDQQGIDALFSSGLKEQELSRQERLERKGLKAHDYQMLLDCLDACPERAFTAEELAEIVGMSRVAVRRYLSEMIEGHEASSRVDLTEDARPVMVYQRAGKGAI